MKNEQWIDDLLAAFEDLAAAEWASIDFKELVKVNVFHSPDEVDLSDDEIAYAAECLEEIYYKKVT